MPVDSTSRNARAAAGSLYATIAAKSITPAAPTPSTPDRPRTTPRGRTRRDTIGELFRGIPWSGA